MATIVRTALVRNKTLHLVVVGATSLSYVAVYAHTPLSVLTSTAPHDDGLFMTLGQTLARGNWLGSYSQFTLMKGPGYPAFLAMASWLGLSVSVAHALFWCGALLVLSGVVAALSGSYLVATVLFLITLWRPELISLRVDRDAIYPGQILLVIALLAASLYCTTVPARRYWLAASAGVALGWCWLTREEGVGLLPGLFMLVTFAISRARTQRTCVRDLLALTACTVLFCLIVLTGFRLANLFEYGSFVGLDVKESNFIAAMNALQSAHVGNRISYVPVSRATRQALYRISPTFASLNDEQDHPGQSVWARWEPFGCHFYPSTCGEIAGGWFMWALRDAAAAHGVYQSPAHASAFFRQLAREVRQSCASRKVACDSSLISLMPPPISLMPHVSSHQVASIPQAFMKSIWMILMRYGPLVDGEPSTGTGQRLSEALAFLNFPLFQSGGEHEISMSGWYYSGGQSWFNLIPTGAMDTTNSLIVSRNPSPDIADYFHDPLASHQRFAISARCTGDCGLAFVSTGGAVNVLSGHLPAAGSLLALGQGKLFFDSTNESGASSAQTGNGYALAASRALRVWLIGAYRVLMPPLFGFSLLAAWCVLIADWRAYAYSPILSLAATAWILLLTRLAILVAVDISAFPAISIEYMKSVFSLTCVAAVLSIAGAGGLANDLKRALVQGVSRPGSVGTCQSNATEKKA
jgi:hypothetical protein